MKTAHHTPRHASTIVAEPSNGRVDIFALALEERFLFTRCRDLFEKQWRDLTFGIFSRAPRGKCALRRAQARASTRWLSHGRLRCLARLPDSGWVDQANVYGLIARFIRPAPCRTVLFSHHS